MSPRIKISILLVGLGLITAFVPFKQNKANQLKPDELLEKAMDEQYMFYVDKVARYVVDEDSSVLIIDLRTPQEYKAFNIPGSINIPYKDLLHRDFGGYLDQHKVKNIFYSNGDILATQAWTLCSRMGYKNNFVMQGGMNEWYNTVMNSNFSGERISARENALFETRFKARKLFTEINSLPDSLKVKFVEAKRKKEMKLDGGCE
ncbi:MAG: rhodanese-like domain-containing protein [Bacteroidales bacterium]|nr:rhodanese-like domain-containing protein [Bacteroidales bacterium]